MASCSSSDDANLKRSLPSLLTYAELLKEIKTRSVKLKSLDKKSKDELLKIYMCHFMPVPQREFPNNNHGKIINQMILKERSKSRRNSDVVKSKHQLGFATEKDNQQSSHLTSKKSGDDSLNCDRLKPPISNSNVGGKRICLSRRPSSSSDPCLDKVVIKDLSKEKCATSNAENNQLNETKVERKRALTDSEKSKEEPSSPKKGRQRIAWP